MKPFDPKIYHIIGMSPGNSYFKEENVLSLLKITVENFGRVGVLIPDIPAISTYMALGYPENRARRDKAIPKGNALKNLVSRIMQEQGYSNDQVRIFNWREEIEENKDYQRVFEKISALYQHNEKFHIAVNGTTQDVLKASRHPIKDLEKSTEIGAHYLLSELAFMEFIPLHLSVEKAVYIYHKNWPVYEDYIAGKFDGIVRPYLDFLLLKKRLTKI